MFLRNILSPSSGHKLKMNVEAISSNYWYQPTRCRNLEDYNMNLNSRENLKLLIGQLLSSDTLSEPTEPRPSLLTSMYTAMMAVPVRREQPQQH
jgi:hypothetical protein